MLYTYEVRLREQGDNRDWEEILVWHNARMEESQLKEVARYLIRDGGGVAVRFSRWGEERNIYLDDSEFGDTVETIDYSEEELQRPTMFDSFSKLFWECICGHTWNKQDEKVFTIMGDTNKTTRTCSTCGGTQIIWMINEEIVRVGFDCKVLV